jgi:hypothetical protein
MSETDDVATAEAMVAELKAKAETLVARQKQLAEERKALAYDAVALKDPKAAKALALLAVEVLKLGTEMEATAAAGEEADRRLAEAQREAAAASDREAARQALAVIDQLVSHGEVLDDALADAVAAGKNLRDCLNRLHNLSIGHPSHEMLHTLGNMAIRTAMAKSIWSRYYESVAPRDRVSFLAVVASWRANLLADINRRLGEDAPAKGAAVVRDDLAIPPFLKRDPSPAEAQP